MSMLLLVLFAFFSGYFSTAVASSSSDDNTWLHFRDLSVEELTTSLYRRLYWSKRPLVNAACLFGPDNDNQNGLKRYLLLKTESRYLPLTMQRSPSWSFGRFLRVRLGLHQLQRHYIRLSSSHPPSRAPLPFLWSVLRKDVNRVELALERAYWSTPLEISHMMSEMTGQACRVPIPEVALPFLRDLEGIPQSDLDDLVQSPQPTLLDHHHQSQGPTFHRHGHRSELMCLKGYKIFMHQQAAHLQTLVGLRPSLSYPREYNLQQLMDLVKDRRLGRLDNVPLTHQQFYGGLLNQYVFMLELIDSLWVWFSTNTLLDGNTTLDTTELNGWLEAMQRMHAWQRTALLKVGEQCRRFLEIVQEQRVPVYRIPVPPTVRFVDYDKSIQLPDGSHELEVRLVPAFDGLGPQLSLLIEPCALDGVQVGPKAGLLRAVCISDSITKVKLAAVLAHLQQTLLQRAGHQSAPVALRTSILPEIFYVAIAASHQQYLSRHSAVSQ